MGVILQNDDLVGGIDSALVAKIGSAPLQTQAQDLSGAVNELVNSSSDVSVTQKVSSGENIASITVDGTTTELYATNTTYSDFVGATSETAGVHGLVIAPTASESDKYLKGDGTWGTPPDTTYTAATAAPDDINTTGAVGSSTNYARQDHTHKIALATGDSNGQVKIAGTNVSVKGLDNSAYKDYTTSVTQGSTDLVTSGAVATAMSNLPEPMVMKGTLGNEGTITSLPTASAENEGYTYKVITDGTYASQSAKVGDVFVSVKPEGSPSYSWLRIPSGDDIDDTWRNIKVNGVEKLASAISSGAVDFIDGTNTTVSFDATGNKISISATDTTYSDFTGATSSAAGAHGLVPAPATTDVGKFLSADGTWEDGGKPMVILSCGNSTWAEFEAAYKNNVIVYCRASSGNDPSVGSQTRMAFMAYVNDATNPTEVEFQYYRSVSTKSDSNQGDQVFIYKLNKTSGWTYQTRNTYSKIVAGTNMASSYSNGTLTLSATDTTYSDFGGATSQVAGSHGLVPAPTTSDTGKFLKGDGTWGTASTSDANVTQSPVSTDADYEVLFSGTADNTEHTEGVGKDSGLKYNPNEDALTVGGNITIGGVLTDKNGMQSIKRISEADYQALSTAEKNNGTIYNRYDATSSASLDTNVSQTESTANADYEVLLSNSASTTTETSGAKKSAGLKFNPSTGNVTASGKITVGTAPTANMDVATKKYVDDAIDTAINTVLATPF